MNGWTEWIITLVQKLGFPVLVALFFMSMFAGWIPNPVLAMSERLQQMIERHDKANSELIKEQTSLLRVICRRMGGARDCD